MKYKKSEGLLGWQTIVVLVVILAIGIILLAATGTLGEIGRNIWKGIKDVLPLV